jgi:hypothetical protein
LTSDKNQLTQYKDNLVHAIENQEFDSIPLTPDGYLITLGFYSGRGLKNENYYLLKGKILAIKKDENKDPYLLLEVPNYNRTSTRMIYIDQIATDKISVAIFNSLKRINKIQTLFENSIQRGRFITYTSYEKSSDSPITKTVKINKVITDRDGTQSFIYKDSDGLKHTDNYKHIDLNTIRVFEVKPKHLTRTDLNKLKLLEKAFLEKKYVSFRYKNKFNLTSKLYEGWVTAVELNSNGEYKITLNSKEFKEDKMSYDFDKSLDLTSIENGSLGNRSINENDFEKIFKRCASLAGLARSIHLHGTQSEMQRVPDPRMV